jgi:phage terminase large subunit
VLTDLTHDQVPKDWPRYWAIDFGYKNPFVWQAWAEDPDGRLFRYKEIYKTGVIVEDHAKKILEVTKDEPRPRAIVCDHDAEDRATLEKHLGMRTVGAYKAVSAGIQAVESRLRKDPMGKARIFYLRDSVIEIDQSLRASKQPTCTEDEYDVYIWDQSANRKRGEEPKKAFDHGQDTTRYIVVRVDGVGKFTPKMFGMISVTKSGDSSSAGGDRILERSGGWHMDTNAPRKFGRE